MRRQWWGAAPAVLLLVGALALGGGVVAQGSTVPDNDLGLVAEIHAGSCAKLATAVAFPLGTLTRSGTATSGTGSGTASGFVALGTGVVGASGAAPVWTTQRTLDVAPGQLFGTTAYAIVVGEPGPTGAVAACGDLGGVVANGALAVALLPGAATAAGTVTGVAVFDAPPAAAVTGGIATRTPTTATGAGGRTRVTVYVFRLAAPTTATPSPTATATEMASPVPTEAPATATATEAATATETGSPTA